MNPVNPVLKTGSHPTWHGREELMDFREAIQAHAEWKMKLTAYIGKPDRSLDPQTVGGDANCVLGKWLKGEGSRYSASPEFADLVADHARFHKAAAEIIRRADAGEKLDSEIALCGNSEYSRSSNSVVSSLMRMKAKVATNGI
jgi:methyl-accepting chemotaxis protein